MYSSAIPPPSKRPKLPLHLLCHEEDEADDLNSRPPPPLLASSVAQRSADLNFNQLVPETTTPFLISSLFSSSVMPRNYERSKEGQSGKGRVRDVLGDGRCLSLSLSSDRRCAGRDLDEFPVSYEPESVGHGVWRSSVPLGPFTGYASILRRSRFLKPAQDLLDELSGVDWLVVKQNSFQGVRDDGANAMDLIHRDDSARKTCKDSSMIILLDEVFKRYKQYYQHLQSVVASFESVCGLENAAPCISFTLRSMTQHFSCLKKTILERAQIARDGLGYTSPITNAALGCQESRKSSVNLKPVQTSSVAHHSVWRSQRGLPACAVNVFKNWLFEHFLHPYPSDTDKNLLAQQTGLSRNQVSNWFINARVRLWKPLVEEMHTLDEQQGQPAPKFDRRTSKASVLYQPQEDTHPVDHRDSAVALQMSHVKHGKTDRSKHWHLSRSGSPTE